MSRHYAVFFLALLCANIFAQTQVFYVSTSGSDTNSGSISNPFRTLTRALQTITQPTIIEITDSGTYIENLNPVLSFPVNITSTFLPTVRSNAGAVISHTSPVTLGLQGLRISSGSQSTVVATNGNIIIDRCIFTAGSSTFSLLDASTNVNSVFIQGSSFIGSTSTNRGAIVYDQQSTSVLTVRNTYFEQFFPGGTLPTRNGGAISVTGGTIIISGCTFKGVFATNGGGIHGSSIVRAELTNLNFTECLATAGAAIHLQNSAPSGNISINTITAFNCTSRGDAIIFINNFMSVAAEGVTLERNTGVMSHLRISSGSEAVMGGTSAIVTNFRALQNNVTSTYSTMLITFISSARVQGARVIGNSANFAACTTAINLRLVGPSTVSDVYCANNLYASGGCVYITGNANLYTNVIRVLDSVMENNKGGLRFGNTGNGAGIFGSFTSIQVENCQFRGNAGRSGVGIIILGGHPNPNQGLRSNSLTVRNCTFISNSGNRGGAGIYADRATLVVQRSVFSRCIAINQETDPANTAYAGAIAAFSNVGMTVDDTEFSDNAAYGQAGAIQLVQNAQATFSNVRFLRNKVFGGNFPPGVGNGGSIYCSTFDAVEVRVTITNSIFDGNEATGNGGAIFCGQAVPNTGSDYLSITNSVFSNNLANALGGAIYSGDSFDIINTNFTNNTAAGNMQGEGEGGAIAIQAVDTTFVSTLVNCVFKNNRGVRSPDLAAFGGTLTVTDCNFLNSVARSSAGSMRINSGTVCSITRCTFSGCVSQTGSGGALQTSGFTTITDTVFLNNTSTEGGAIRATSNIGFDARMSLIRCLFRNNAVGNGFGGAITADLESQIAIQDTLIENNRGGIGGGIAAFCLTFVVNNTRFLNNIASTSGGAVYTNGFKSYFFYDSIFDSNIADIGGALQLEGSGIRSCQNCSIRNNRASLGGGISASGRIALQLQRSTVAQNNATNGAGIYMSAMSNIAAVDSTISSNTAITNSGGCYLRLATTASFINCRIVGNTARYYGGGLSCTGSSVLNMIGTVVEQNAVSDTGGGVFLSGLTSASISNSTIRSNGARNGGGIFIYEFATLNVANSILQNNTAFKDGGGIYAEGGQMYFSGDNSILENSATSKGSFGGGIRVVSAAKISNVGNMLFRRNLGYFGAGISYHLPERSFLGNIVFQNNVAQGGGGGMYWDSNQEPIYNASITNLWQSNQASYGPNVATNSRTAIPFGATISNISAFEEFSSSVATTDYYNQVVTVHAITTEVLAVIAEFQSGAALIGNTRSTLSGETTSNRVTLKLNGSPKLSYTILYTSNSLQSSNQSIFINPCKISEEEKPNGNLTICISCGTNFFKTTANGTCQRCPPGGNCERGGSTIVAARGFWRDPADPTKFYECSTIGCEDTGISPCVPGYEGTLCKQCSANYFPNGASCLSCPDYNSSLAISILGAILLALFFLYFFFTSGATSKHGGTAIRKILLRHLQLIALFYVFSEAPWRESYAVLGKFVSLTFFDINDILFMECVNPEYAKPQNFYIRNLYKMLLPFSALIIFAMCFLVRSLLAKLRPEIIRQHLAVFMRRSILFLMLIYPGVAAKVISYYNCKQIGSFTYLFSDVSVKCTDDVYRQNWPLNLVFLIIYVVGFPLVLSLIVIGIFIKRFLESKIEEALDKQHPENSRFLDFINYIDRELFAAVHANYDNHYQMLVCELADIGKMVAYAIAVGLTESFVQFQICGIVVFVLLAYKTIMNPFVYRVVNELASLSDVVLVITVFGGVIASFYTRQGEDMLWIDILVTVLNFIGLIILLLCVSLTSSETLHGGLITFVIRTISCGKIFPRGVKVEKKTEEISQEEKDLMQLQIAQEQKESIEEEDEFFGIIKENVKSEEPVVLPSKE